MPRLSILIPVLNTERYLAQTIESVLAQTYTDWELIILNDASTDNTLTIALDYQKKYPSKISVFSNEQNLGMMQNWNKGISLCTSELFVKLDADDLWLPTFLEKSIAALDKHKDIGLIFTKYLLINESNIIQENSQFELPDFANERPFNTIPLVQSGQDTMLQYPVMRQGLSVMRRQIFNKIGLYDSLLTLQTQATTDIYFYFKLGCHYNIYCINETLYQYRVHESSISQTDKNKGLAIKKMYELKTCILKYYLKENKIEKGFYKQQQRDVDFVYFLNQHQLYTKPKSLFVQVYNKLKVFVLFPIFTISYYAKKY